MCITYFEQSFSGSSSSSSFARIHVYVWKQDKNHTLLFHFYFYYSFSIFKLENSNRDCYFGQFIAVVGGQVWSIFSLLLLQSSRNIENYHKNYMLQNESEAKKEEEKKNNTHGSSDRKAGATRDKYTLTHFTLHTIPIQLNLGIVMIWSFQK